MNNEFENLITDTYKHLKDKDIYSYESYQYISKCIKKYMHDYNVSKERMIAYIKSMNYDFDINSVIGYNSIAVTIIVALIPFAWCNVIGNDILETILKCVYILLVLISLPLLLYNTLICYKGFTLKNKILEIMLGIVVSDKNGKKPRSNII